MENYQIGSDTSRSAQIISGLSELQSGFKQFQIVSLRPKRPQKDPLGAKAHYNFVFVVVSYGFIDLS